MPVLTPELAGNAMIGSFVLIVFSLIYNIYMAIVNYKQAKVKDLMIKNNELLKEIRDKLK